MTVPAQPSPIPAGENEFIFPASLVQRRIWYAEKAQPGGNFYVIWWAIRSLTPFDLVISEKVINEIVSRHEALRTCFTESGGEPQQLVRERLNVKIARIDLSALSPAEASARVDQLTHDFSGPFDLSQAPLFRAMLVYMPAECCLFLAMHHTIFDGWSRFIFYEEAAVLYDAFRNERPSPLPEPLIQYADYTVWKKDQLQNSPTLKGQLEYWKKQLEGFAKVELPTDYPRTGIPNSRAKKLDISVDNHLLAKLKELGQRESATIFMVLLAGFQVLLFRETGQSDISVATTLAGRNRPETRAIIGCFINTLLLRVRMSAASTFLETLGQVRKAALGAYENQDVPFEAVLDALIPGRDPLEEPPYRIGFSMHNLPPLRTGQEAADLQILEFDNHIAKVDLSIALKEHDKGIVGAAKYNQEIFEESTVTALFRRFKSLLESAAEVPHQRIMDLKLGD
jgi:hypothetical protein